MSFPRVKDVLVHYQAGGMVAVARYLSDEDLTIDPDTWTGKMKRLLDSNNWGSMEAEIASLLHTFKLNIEDGTENTTSGDNKSEGSGDSGPTPDTH